MTALDMTGNYSVVLLVAAYQVKRFEHLHKSVALEKARANHGTWVPHDGKLYKVTTILVYDETGNIALELTSPSEPPRPAFREEDNVKAIADSMRTPELSRELLDYDPDKLPCSEEESEAEKLGLTVEEYLNQEPVTYVKLVNDDKTYKVESTTTRRGVVTYELEMLPRKDEKLYVTVTGNFVEKTFKSEQAMIDYMMQLHREEDASNE